MAELDETNDLHHMRANRSSRAEAGQASLELLAGIPALIAAAALALQLLAAGYAATLVDGAVEAGALAIAAGHEPEPAVRNALPGWASGQIDTEVDGGNLRVTVAPPTVVPGLARHLAVSSSAWARQPDSEG